MPRKPRDVERILTGKFGFIEAKGHSSDHRWYELRLVGLPVILTKVSHSKSDIGPSLESKMARQLRVKKTFLGEMVDCTKDATDYERQIRAAPEPPWDVRF
jgi:hypothetical protein